MRGIFTVPQVRSLAKATLRRLTGKNDIRAHWRVKKLAAKKRFYRKPISESDLRTALEKLGVTEGRTVWMQSSWNEFFNFEGKPRAFIDLVLEMIGPSGTLVMPAIPIVIDPSKIFEVDRAPVATGLICEYFRRYPNVKRSIHNSSSVVALGPNADFLTRDHHLTETTWDPDSPYMRLMDVDALCVSVGLGGFMANLTPLHAVESVLRHEITFFRDLFTKDMEYRWRTKDGREGTHRYFLRDGVFDGARFGRLYPKQLYTQLKISNLDLWSITARDAIETGIELGRKGISMYTRPYLSRASMKLISGGDLSKSSALPEDQLS